MDKLLPTNRWCRRRAIFTRVCILLLATYFVSAWISNNTTSNMTKPMRNNVKVKQLFTNVTNISHNTSSLINTNDGNPKSLHPNFGYILENSKLCSSTQDLKVMVLVHSAPLNQDKRQAIRSTWTNNSNFPDLGQIRVMFVIGNVINSSVQQSIKSEFIKYGDILQGDFIDHYKNITYKAILGFKWLTERCRNAEVILKADDDMMVNTRKLFQDFLPTFTKSPRHIACRRLHNSIIYRDKKSKWYVDSSEFEGKRNYPDFCQGFVVAISNDVIPELYMTSLTTKFFWIDDIFMYGVVSGKLPSMKYTSFRYGTDVTWGVDRAMNCYKSSQRSCPYLAIMPWLNVSNSIRELWTAADKQYQNKH